MVRWWLNPHSIDDIYTQYKRVAVTQAYNWRLGLQEQTSDTEPE